MSSRTSNSLKNIASNLGLKLLMVGLQFATRTLFIHNLGTLYNGINSLVSSTLSFLNIAELGIGSAIVFAMYKPIADDDKEKVKQYLDYYKKIYHTLGFVVLAIGLVMMPFLPYMMKDLQGTASIRDVYIIYALYLFQSFTSFFWYADRRGFLTARQEDYKVTAINYTTSILSVVSQGVILSTVNGFFGFVLYVALPIAFEVARNLAKGFFIAKSYPYIKEKPEGRLSKEEKKELYKNTLGLSIAKLSAIINNAVDSIIISTLIGVEILGRYHNYQTLILMVASFVGMLFTSLIPSIGNLGVSSDTENRKRIFSIINFLAFWIHGLCAIIYFVVVQPFVRIWIGEANVMYSIPMMVAICLNFLTQGMCYSTAVFREGCGLYYQGRYRPIFTALFNILFSVILGKFFGIPGIIFATVLSRFITTWWFDAYIVFKYVFAEKPYKYLLDYVLKLIIIGVGGTLTAFLCSLHSLTGVLEIIVNGMIALITVNCIFLLLFFKTKEFTATRNFALNFVRRIKSKQ